MPAAVSHYLLARSILPQLGARVPKLNEAAYFYGAQGPDILFYHRAAFWQRGKSLRSLGSRIHRSDPDKPLALMRAYWNDSSGDGDILSYILGYLAHYALDRTAHPYVYALQERIIREEKIRYRPFFVHNHIENSLDVIMLRNIMEVLPPEFNPASVLRPDDAALGKAAALLAAVFGELYPGEASEKQFLQAFADLRANLSHLHDSTGVKRILMSGLEKLLHTGPAVSAMIRPVREDGAWDYANLARSMWRNPAAPGVARRETYFELFEIAQRDAMHLTDGFINMRRGGDFAGLTAKLGFNTGAPVRADQSPVSDK